MEIGNVSGNDSVAARAAESRREEARTQEAEETRARESESSGRPTADQRRTEDREDNTLRASLGEDRGGHLDIQA